MIIKRIHEKVIKLWHKSRGLAKGAFDTVLPLLGVDARLGESKFHKKQTDIIKKTFHPHGDTIMMYTA